MKRLKNYRRVAPQRKMETCFRKENSLLIILFSILVYYSWTIVCFSDFVEGTRNTTNITNFVWKRKGEVSVIQGYPQRYHQGYNWSRSHSVITDSLSSRKINRSVEGIKDNSKGKNKTSRVTPKAVISSTPPPSVGTTPFNSWKPLIIEQSDLSKKIGLRQSAAWNHTRRNSRVEADKVINSGATNSGNQLMRDLYEPSVYKNEIGNSTITIDDDASRKLEMVVPLHPRVNYLAGLFSRALSPLFSVVSSWNQKCWSAGFDQGNCYSKKECLIRGGSPRGLCAGGFGVCCVFSYTCDSATPLNGTYFVNPEFPFSVSKVGTTCEHTIKNLEGICQLRLDFEVFHLESPNPDGLCLQDAIHFFGVDIKLPPLCGDLTGHHVYLPVGIGPTVSYTLTLTGIRPWRRWKIGTIKIPCGSGSVAPGGCLQNYWSPYGRVTSFNNAENTGGINILDLNYGVCVRKERGFCAIRWSKCGHSSHHHYHDGASKRRRRRRDTENLMSANTHYVSLINAEKQKQLERAFSTPTLQMEKTNKSMFDGERQKRLVSYSPLIKINSWKPMPEEDLFINDIITSDGVGKMLKVDNNLPSLPTPRNSNVQYKENLKVAVNDFLGDLTNALHITSKSNQKVKGDSGIVSSVKRKGQTALSTPAAKKPAKFSVFTSGKGKKPSISSFGSRNKNKKPLKLKSPSPFKNIKKPLFFNHKKGNGKKKTKGKNKKKKGKHRKKKNKKGCGNSLFPFPLPIAIPFPFGGGGGGGGGGGAGGKEEGGWGWSDDTTVFTTAMEPFLIRIVTDKWKENTLAPVCLEWEQISCDDWYSNQHSEF